MRELGLRPPRVALPGRVDRRDEGRGRLIERILYLEGLPNLQRLGVVRVGETVPEQITLALDLEREAIERLNNGIGLCLERSDGGTP